MFSIHKIGPSLQSTASLERDGAKVMTEMLDQSLDRTMSLGLAGAALGGTFGHVFGGTAGKAFGSTVGSVLGGPAGTMIGAFSMAAAGYSVGKAQEQAARARLEKDIACQLKFAQCSTRSLVEDLRLATRLKNVCDALPSMDPSRELWAPAIKAAEKNAHNKVADLINKNSVLSIDVEMFVTLLTDEVAQRSSRFCAEAEAMLPALRRVPELMQLLTVAYRLSKKHNADLPATYDQRRKVLEDLLDSSVVSEERANEIGRLFAKSLGKDTAEAAIPLLFNVAVGGAFLPMAAAKVALFSVTPSLTRVTKSLFRVPETEILERERLARIHRARQSHTVGDVTLLPFSVQKIITMIDREIDSRLLSGSLTDVKTLLYRREAFLSYPTQPKMGSEKDIDAKVGVLLDAFAHIPELPNIVRRIRKNSSASPSKANRQINLFLVGSPGTGMKHFVETLAWALERPLERINLSDERSIEKTLPPLHLSSSADTLKVLCNGEIADGELLSAIPFALVHAGCTNPINYWQEAGRLMHKMPGVVSRVNEVLNEGQTQMASPWMNENKLSVNNSQATNIFEGEEAPKDHGLLSSCTVIHFGALPKERKEAICLENIDTLTRSLPGRSHAYRQGIVEEVRRYLHILVDADQEAGHHGVTYLLRAARMLVDEAEEVTDRGAKLTESEVRKLVQIELKNVAPDQKR